MAADRRTGVQRQAGCGAARPRAQSQMRAQSRGHHDLAWPGSLCIGGRHHVRRALSVQQAHQRVTEVSARVLHDQCRGTGLRKGTQHGQQGIDAAGRSADQHHRAARFHFGGNRRAGRRTRRPGGGHARDRADRVGDPVARHVLVDFEQSGADQAAAPVGSFGAGCPRSGQEDPADVQGFEQRPHHLEFRLLRQALFDHHQLRPMILDHGEGLHQVACPGNKVKILEPLEHAGEMGPYGKALRRDDEADLSHGRAPFGAVRPSENGTDAGFGHVFRRTFPAPAGEPFGQGAQGNPGQRQAGIHRIFGPHAGCGAVQIRGQGG